MDFVLENKKTSGIVLTAVLFFKKIWKSMVGFFNTGKTILTEIRGLGGVLAEIKEESSATKRLIINNDQLFKSYMDLDDNGRFQTDKDGNITWCNRYILDLLGVQKDEFYGRSWFDLIEPSYKYDTMYEWRHKIMAGHNISKDIAMIDISGAHIFVKITARIIRDKGEVISYVGTVKKIDNSR